MLVGLTRVRNESLIIEDTIQHMLGYCDRVLLFDDASTDGTADIAAGFDKVEVFRGKEWSATGRQWLETAHRALLLEAARKRGAEWCLYMDADERLVGDLPGMTGDTSGYRFKLFDGYMTEEHRVEYASGSLAELPRLYGPERRDILMLFRTEDARYLGLDQREPVVHGPVETTSVYVKHFGKCLSVEQWEETCDYYATFFPEPYKSKWEARRGGAIHAASDFGRPLYAWDELLARPEVQVRI
jgi:glycosyltransferase involved in cell wall biosynthesis